MRPHYVSHAPFTEMDFGYQCVFAKVIGILNCRVASMPRLAFEGLEPYDGNLSRTVLRGLGAGNSPRLPGLFIKASLLAKKVSASKSLQSISLSKHRRY
jgi:hypothetical protein